MTTRPVPVLPIGIATQLKAVIIQERIRIQTQQSPERTTPEASNSHPVTASKSSVARKARSVKNAA